MINKSTRNLVLLVVAVIVAVLVVAWIAWSMLLAPPTYTAVSLSSGELYFGELQNFPEFGLSNVYTIQATGNQEQPLSIQRFENTFWGPEGFLRINKDEIIWSAELDSASQLVQVIEQNPNLMPQQQTAPTDTPSQQETVQDSVPTTQPQDAGQ